MLRQTITEPRRRLAAFYNRLPWRGFVTALLLLLLALLGSSAAGADDVEQDVPEVVPPSFRDGTLPPGCAWENVEGNFVMVDTVEERIAVLAPSPDSPVEPLDVNAALALPDADTGALALPTDTTELLEYLAGDYVPFETELDINESVALALESNHNLNAKRLEAAAAVQGVKLNWSSLRPQLSMQGKVYQQESNLTPQQGMTSNDGEIISSLAFGLTQRIYDFGLTTDLIDLAEAQHGILNYTVDMVEQQLVTDLISAHYNYNLALGQLRVRHDELRLAGEFLRQAEIQYDVGTAPRLDVIRAEARLEQAREGYIAAQAGLGDAAAYFFSLLGVEDQRYVPAMLTPELLEIGEPLPALDDAVQAGLSYRPELELQYATLFAGEAQHSLAANRPFIEGYANAYYQEPTSTFQGTDNYEFGVQLSWPLYTGGKDSIQREQARLKLAALAQDVLDLEVKIELDVTTAWNRAQAALSTADASRKNLELSGEALRAASVGYRAGVTTYIEFENAMDKNVAAAIGYIVALAEVKKARVNLTRAQGYPQGYPGDPRADVLEAEDVAGILGVSTFNVAAINEEAVEE